MNEATLTANAIDELLNTAKPAPDVAVRARAVAKDDGKNGELVPERQGTYFPPAGRRLLPRPQPAPVSAEEEYYGLSAKAPVGPVIPSAPAKLAQVAGLPDVEADPDLIAARANYARLVADLTATHAERTALEKELGITANVTPAALGKLAEDLLVNGGEYLQVQTLKTLAEKERHLQAACRTAAGRIHPLLEEAKRKLSVAAVAAVVRPAQEALMPAFLELLAKYNALREAEDKVRGAGLDQAMTSISPHPVLTTIGVNETVSFLIQAGLISREQVKAVAPLLDI